GSEVSCVVSASTGTLSGVSYAVSISANGGPSSGTGFTIQFAGAPTVGSLSLTGCFPATQPTAALSLCPIAGGTLSMTGGSNLFGYTTVQLSGGSGTAPTACVSGA